MNAPNLHLDLDRIGTRLKEIGPYFLVEFLLPGGSILALLLWLRQRNRRKAASARPAPDQHGHADAGLPACCRA